MIRFDPLAIAMAALLGAGLAADLIGRRRLARADAPFIWWRCLAATALAIGVVAAGDLRLAAAGLLAIAGIAGRDWWHRGAGLLQAATLIALGVAAGAWGWGDLAVGAAFRSAHVALLLTGAVLALGLVPLRSHGPRAPLTALALSGIYPLLRMYGLGPINWGWTVAAALAGGGSALWFGLAALRAEGLERHELALLALWGAALAPVALATEAGIAATWTLAAAAILVAAAGRRAALYLPVVWLGLWLGAAATLAGGAPLLAAALWLLLLIVSMALLGLGPIRPWPGAALAALPSLLVTLLLPKLLDLLIRPVWTQLGAGLTPFGRLTLWPWLGLAVRNAGSETVATLPSLALAGLMLVALAIGVLLLRARPGAPAGESIAGFWGLIARDLPTARRSPPAVEEPPDDL